MCARSLVVMAVALLLDDDVELVLVLLAATLQTHTRQAQGGSGGPVRQDKNRDHTGVALQVGLAS